MILTLLALEDRCTPADLRIVTYNIAAETGTVRPGLVGNLADGSTANDFGILDTIGKQALPSGIAARPADIILLQETDASFQTLQSVASQLNAYYGAGTYAAGSKAGATSGNGTQGIVYKVSTVNLLEEVVVGTVDSAGAARQTLRHKVGLDGTTTEIVIYNSHLKASSASSDAARRNVDVTALRANADTFPASTNVLFVGDFNFYDSDSSEPAYAKFLSAGNAQCVDVANAANNWKRQTQSQVALYSQAPSATPPSGFSGGGVDDRFDFIMPSKDFADSAGLEYKSGSYRTFGVNGSVIVNNSVNVTSNTSLNNTPLTTTQQQSVLNYLTTVTDHLPVVADFTFPSGPTAVTSYAVNGGVQRSRVTSVAVTFDAPVMTALSASNFSISGFAGTIGVSHSAGSAVATLTFSGGGTESGSLADGLYTLTVNVSGVSNTTFAFHRLFGDVNGDRTVDGPNDSAAFKFTTAANDPFDFNGDGTVDGPTDFAQFGTRFGKTI